MKFEELDLSDNVLDALYDMHFEDCTPVQEKCIPAILEGRDMLGVAQTGTGKTAAYLLPILSKLDEGNYPDNAVNCIIMSPTRELAQQIDQAMQGFSYYTPDVSSVAVYGGNDGNRYDQEMKSMRLGADVIIATPGRLISHISMGNVDLSKVSFFVLDEADRMLDMGFSDDIMKIASKLPKTCQTIMFSATMPKDIEKMSQQLLKNPVEVKLAVSKPADKIQQRAYICYETQKLDIIKDIFKNGDLKRVIIFSGSKQKVKQIHQALLRLHIQSGEMHSDLDQAQRDEMMFKFKSGQIDVLVATDILARGIDIDDIAMVINYDVPHDAEDYVHRIGRTARADRDGVAITFVNEDDMYYFHQIEKFLDKEVEKLQLPEGCGEGPEYVTSRKSKSSAKDRRRKDRDSNAHRRKPRNGNDRQEKQRQNSNKEKPVTENTVAKEGQVKAKGGLSPKPKTDNSPQEGSKNNGRNENQKRQRNNSDNPNDGGRRRNQRRKNRNDRNESVSNDNGERNGSDENNNRGNRYNRNGRNRRNNNRDQANSKPRNHQPIENETKRSIADNKEKKESGLKAIIKRPLRWLFGKK
ncbi:MAG: DEAD/DEAH box helicase [Prevotella sp.]|jgi:ATP-dependent RNA helicase RhlE